MDKVYKSKIGLELVIPIAVIIGGTFAWMLYLHAWAGVIIIIAGALFILHLFTHTYYTISGNTLYVKSGFIIGINIDIMAVTKVTATQNMLSSPALSLDRLEIFYNKYDSVMISPDDKAGFIEQLKSISSGIVFS
ncbi:MAG: PH domain-containing protein [Sphingobacteriales bacterium]